MKENFKEIYELLKELKSVTNSWYSGWGLVFSVIIVLAIEASLFEKYAGLDSPVPFWLYGVSTILIILLWVKSNTLSRSKSGKLGFVVCMAFEDTEINQRVKNDFVYALRRLIRSGPNGRSFDFIEIPQRIAAKIHDIEDAESLKEKCRAGFLLYGRVRERELNGEQHFIIDLNGLVGHDKYIPSGIKEGLAKEFSELLPQRVQFKQANDLVSFEFTSQFIDVVARYIIGLAAAISGDLNYAEKLFLDCAGRVPDDAQDFPVYRRLKERSPTRLQEIYSIKANMFYDAWVKTHNDIYLTGLGEFSEKALKWGDGSAGTGFLIAIFEFLKNRNIEKCFSTLEQVEKAHRNALWQINYAFLSAYKGNLKKASQSYQAALRHPSCKDLLENELYVVFRAEDFACYVINNDPGMVQLYFCLGILNWHFKRDFRLAESDFKQFLMLEKRDEFSREIKLVEDWIGQIKKDSLIDSQIPAQEPLLLGSLN